MINLITGDSLDVLARDANNACASGPINNLLLSGAFPVSELSSSFISSYEGEARDWQAKERPHHLHINHGEFIHKYGDGVDFVERELATKRDSRRACLSLISMKEIIDSQDDPIPSFMVLQFGFRGLDTKELIASAYFRALETSSFLPVNLAEVCLRVRGLHQAFPEIRSFELTLLAFVAYSQPGFHRLQRAELDAVPEAEIGVAVHAHDTDKLRKWINSKLTVEESAVSTSGLRALTEAVKLCQDKYNSEFPYHLEAAYNELCKLREARKRTSSAETLEHLTRKISSHLEKAKSAL